MKKTATQDDLDLNPDLVEKGVAVGDEIEMPEVADVEPPAEGGPGGGQPGGPETGKPKIDDEP